MSDFHSRRWHNRYTIIGMKLGKGLSGHSCPLLTQGLSPGRPSICLPPPDLGASSTHSLGRVELEMVSPHPNATGSGTGSRQPHLANLRKKESLGIMMLVNLRLTQQFHINVDCRGSFVALHKGGNCSPKTN